MTADEFEQQYAARSKVTVEELRALGRIVLPCDCGEDDCEGWQSISRDRAEEEARDRMRPEYALNYMGAKPNRFAAKRPPREDLTRMSTPFDDPRVRHLSLMAATIAGPMLGRLPASRDPSQKRANRIIAHALDVAEAILDLAEERHALGSHTTAAAANDDES